MATIAEMLERVKAVDLLQEAITVIKKYPEVLEDYIKIQLRQGLGKDGRVLLWYRDDPFFKGIKSWYEGYERWKKSLGRSDPKKPEGAADFYINGYTHDHINVVVQGGKAIFGSSVPWGEEIDDKTNGRAFGMTPDSMKDYRETHLLPEMLPNIKRKLGVN